MGKNLKGKECGKGICQRKDGLYSARYVDELGKRHDKYFPTLPEARNWLKQAKEAFDFIELRLTYLNLLGGRISFTRR